MSTTRCMCRLFGPPGLSKQITLRRSCPPLDRAEGDARKHCASGTSELILAGVVCAKLWTSSPVCRLVQNVIIREKPEELDQLMPFVRCFNEFLLDHRGQAPTTELTVCRTSRLTHVQGQTIIPERTYRIGMFVSTMRTSKPGPELDVLREWQTKEMSERPTYQWVFTIPVGCRQVRWISPVSEYRMEREVTMVPYTAVHVERKETNRRGRRPITTIYARVLEDSCRVPE
eukprot:COSAG02_NODE_2181_length_9586_cov_3.262254_7_plen_230_part_00